MWPVLIPAAISLGTSIYQGIKANQIANDNERQAISESEAAQRAAAIAGNEALGAVRQGREYSTRDIFQNQANSLEALRSNIGNQGDYINAVSATQGSTNRALQQQDLVDLQARNAAMGQYMGALGQQAQQQTLTQNYNIIDKYKENANTASALKESAMNNFMNSISDIAAGYLQYKSGQGATTTNFPKPSRPR